MTKKYAHKQLPPGSALLAEYMSPHGSMRAMAEKYGWSHHTIREKLKAAAKAQDLDWPLKSLSNTHKRQDLVPVDLSHNTLRDIRLRYGIPLTKVAKLTGLGQGHVYDISSRRFPRIKRTTQAKILELAAQLDAEELRVERSRWAIDRSADVCYQGHRYTGKRDKNGHRECVMCASNKIRRDVDKRRKKRAA